MKIGLRNTKKVVRVDFWIFVFGAIYSAKKGQAVNSSKIKIQKSTPILFFEFLKATFMQIFEEIGQKMKKS